MLRVTSDFNGDCYSIKIDGNDIQLTVGLNVFGFSRDSEIIDSWLVYPTKFSWITQSNFLTEETIKRGDASFFFLLFRIFLKKK